MNDEIKKKLSQRTQRELDRGERFWPVSREKVPKQLLTLLGGRSFLQQAVDRVLPLMNIAGAVLRECRL